MLGAVTEHTLKETIEKTYLDQDLYNKMKAISLNKGASTFSYYNMAKRAIEL